MEYKVNHISYKYTDDGPLVLKDINFDIQPGKITAIVGPSGCGKTTLLEVFSKVIPELIKNGTLTGSFDVPENTMVSVVSQNPENQLFGYGVEDAIAFGIENMGVPQEEIAERMEYVLDLLNLQTLRDRSVANLSGGQRQAVCIASVLALNPDILFLDEPVSSLDPNGKKMVQDIMKQLSISGNTVVLVDNNLVWSAGVVDHVIGLFDGEVVFDGSRDEFFKDFELQKKLGVIIPQEVEIYRALSESIPDLKLFYNVDDAKEELGKYLPEKVFDTPAPEYVRDHSVIEVSNLVKTFKDGFHALIDVNANVSEGKVVAIMGQNGSGKTTFVKHLNGLYKPTSGDVKYRGESVITKTVAQISHNVILVFQHPEHMLFEDTVEEELTFVARMQKVEFTPEQIAEVLEKYHLTEDKETFPLNLSMGKKHLLTILSVLFSSADTIIFDEPTLGMDAFLIGQLEELVAELKAAGKTVIMISHEIPLIFRTMDEAIILNNGEKIFEGGKEELARKSDLFASININMPPVIQLSNYFGLDHMCFNVPDFAETVLKTMKEAK